MAARVRSGAVNFSLSPSSHCIYPTRDNAPPDLSSLLAPRSDYEDSGWSSLHPLGSDCYEALSPPSFKYRLGSDSRLQCSSLYDAAYDFSPAINTFAWSVPSFKPVSIYLDDNLLSWQLEQTQRKIQKRVDELSFLNRTISSLVHELAHFQLKNEIACSDLELGLDVTMGNLSISQKLQSLLEQCAEVGSIDVISSWLDNFTNSHFAFDAFIPKVVWVLAEVVKLQQQKIEKLEKFSSRVQQAIRKLDSQGPGVKQSRSESQRASEIST